EESKRNLLNEEAKASLDIWRYALGIADIAAAKCAIDLKIPEAIETHPSSQPVKLAELSSTISASPSHLRRIMRFLVHLGVFKEVPTEDGLTTGYTNTPLSRRMLITKRDGKSMAPLILFETNHEMLAPWLSLSSVVSSPVNGSHPPPFDAVHGKDVWALTKDNPCFGEMINEAMACDARRVVPRLAGACHDLFDGRGYGGGRRRRYRRGDGNLGFNFDLPHVIEVAQVLDGVEMLEAICLILFQNVTPSSSMGVTRLGRRRLHLNIEELQRIKYWKSVYSGIYNQRQEKTMMVEERDKKLMLDIAMMAHTTTGKERTLKEWDFVLNEAGFARYEVRDIDNVHCVIIANLVASFGQTVALPYLPLPIFVLVQTNYYRWGRDLAYSSNFDYFLTNTFLLPWQVSSSISTIHQ
ncbi:hypothetical protein HID58_057786, partial [Brassica napus]